jgi:SEC-C motif domain protein
VSKETIGSKTCVCSSGRRFDECCGPLLDRQSNAETAETLMRSRYAAYTLHDTEYLLNTWHENYRPASLVMDENQKWLGLKIKAQRDGLQGDDDGVVEFVARYKIGGRAYRLHEISRFTKVDGDWVYLDGEIKS